MNARAKAAIALLNGKTSTPTPKAPKAPKSRSSKEERLEHEARLGNKPQASTFGVYRPETREVSGIPVTPGSAGVNSAARKMQQSIERVIALCGEDVDCPLATDDSLLASFERVELGSIALIQDLLRKVASCESLAAKYDGEKAIAFATEAIVQRGMVQDKLAKLYKLAGIEEIVEESTIAGDFGTFGADVLTVTCEVEHFEGEAYALPCNPIDARRIRCRAVKDLFPSNIKA
jgi:hypothetical protein